MLCRRCGYTNVTLASISRNISISIDVLLCACRCLRTAIDFKWDRNHFWLTMIERRSMCFVSSEHQLFLFRSKRYNSKRTHTHFVFVELSSFCWRKTRWLHENQKNMLFPDDLDIIFIWLSFFVLKFQMLKVISINFEISVWVHHHRHHHLVQLACKLILVFF